MNRPTHDNPDEHVELDANEARSGEKGPSVNWVLHISTAGAVVALVLVWIFVI